jgi:hypothetical protein
MAELIRKLGAWLRGGAGTTVPTKLTEAEAIAIAQAAAAAADHVVDLTMATTRLEGGRVIWNVSEPVVGSKLVVEIDDQTSAVIDVRRVGFR